MLHRQKHLFRRMALALIVVLAVLLPMGILTPAARADEPPSGYAWEKVGETVDPFSGLWDIGTGRLLTTSNSINHQSYLVDIQAQTTQDFGFSVSSATKIRDGDFFFVEKDFDNVLYYLRRCTDGVVSDRLLTDVDFGGSIYLTGEGNDIYAIGYNSKLMHFDISTETWSEITIDLPAASFLVGQCTPSYLYLANRKSDGNAALYRYDRTNHTWTDLSPDSAALFGKSKKAIVNIWVSADDSLITAFFEYRYKVCSYHNGQWSYDFDAINYIYGASVNNNPVIGSGILIANQAIYYFNSGTGWAAFEQPSDIIINPEYNPYYSYLCSDTDGNTYTWVGESSNQGNIYKLVSSGAADETAPEITTNAQDETVGSSSYTFTVKAEDAVDGVVTPIVKLGGESGMVLTGSAQGDGSYSYTAELAEGDNTIYIEATDESANKATATCTVTYTPAAGDTTPPAFDSGYPAIDNITATGFDLAVKLDEPGVSYYKVVADGADSGTGYESWTSVVVPGTDAVTVSVSGLTPATAYDVYVIAQDSAGNLQPAPVQLDVTTEAGEPDLQELTGYAWEKVGEAVDPAFGLFAIGDGRLIASSFGTSYLVDTQAQTTQDFGYFVVSVQKVGDGDFFFVEYDLNDGLCYIRRCTDGVVSDRMISEVDFGGWISLVGEGNDIYAFGFGSKLMHFDINTGSWSEIPADLPAALFYAGQCTSSYLYLAYGAVSDNSAALYRYDRTNHTWLDLSPDTSELIGFSGVPIHNMWVTGDDALISICLDFNYHKLYSYKNGQWAHDFDATGGYNYGTCVNNNPLIGSGILITNSAYYYFNSGSAWVDLEKPADIINPNNNWLYSYICSDSDGSIYTWVGENSSLSNIYKLVSAVAADETPPVITTSAADGTVSSSTYTFTVKAEDEVDGVVTPTVKLGGESGTVLTGSAQDDGSYSYTAELAEGDNTIYIEATDESANKATATCTVTYTPAAGDSTPPAFNSGYPAIDNITATGFDLAVKLDEPGVSYYKVVADGDDPGIGYESWTFIEITGTETVTAGVSGLTPATAYDVYVIAKDTAGNWQAAPVKLDITTTRGSAQTGFSIERVGSGGFSHGQVASITVQMTNNTGASQQATLLLCLYNNTSKSMENYAFVSGEVADVAQVEMTTEGFSIPASGDYSVRAFVWDSFEGMRPLLDSPLQMTID